MSTQVNIIVHYADGSSTIGSRKDILDAFNTIHALVSGEISKSAGGPVVKIEVERIPGKLQTVWNTYWMRDDNA